MNIQTFNTVLLLIFITLKLAGFIAWSWLWVLAPLWIPLLLAAVLTAAYYAVTSKQERENDRLRNKLNAYARRLDR